ncbi:MAG: hypothetical protein ABIH52_02640, partial [Candidatus Aenigmatarchaeota archaeon]
MEREFSSDDVLRSLAEIFGFTRFEAMTTEAVLAYVEAHQAFTHPIMSIMYNHEKNGLDVGDIITDDLMNHLLTTGENGDCLFNITRLLEFSRFLVHVAHRFNKKIMGITISGEISEEAISKESSPESSDAVGDRGSGASKPSTATPAAKPPPTKPRTTDRETFETEFEEKSEIAIDYALTELGYEGTRRFIVSRLEQDKSPLEISDEIVEITGVSSPPIVTWITLIARSSEGPKKLRAIPSELVESVRKKVVAGASPGAKPIKTASEDDFVNPYKNPRDIRADMGLRKKGEKGLYQYIAKRRTAGASFPTISTEIKQLTGEELTAKTVSNRFYNPLVRFNKEA